MTLISRPYFLNRPRSLAICIGMCTMFGGVVGIATMSLSCAFARLGAASSATRGDGRYA